MRSVQPLLCRRRTFYRGNIDLLHGHHRLHRTPSGITIRPADEFEQPPGRDLPRKAPAVLAPAAWCFSSAIAGNGSPISVGLFLAISQDHETYCLIRLEVGAAVQSYEGPA